MVISLFTADKNSQESTVIIIEAKNLRSKLLDKYSTKFEEQ